MRDVRVRREAAVGDAAGHLGDGDKRANEEAIQTGERILSRYDLECGSFYIVTEADRSTTTVMGVEEY